MSATLTRFQIPPPADFDQWTPAEQAAWHTRLRNLAWHYSTAAPVRLVDPAVTQPAVREETRNAPPAHLYSAQARAAYRAALKRLE